MYEKLHQFKWIDGILGLGMLLMAIGIGINVSEKLKQPTASFVKAAATPTSIIVVQGDSKVTFDVGGEVINPGVYKLNKGARISEGLTAANGLSANADRDWVEKNINRAEVIKDGMKIYVPRRQPTGVGAMGGQAKVGVVLGTALSEIVDINTANLAELDRLTGIGPAIAQRIIDYREKNGGFKDVNEIKMVSGIGDKLFEKIKDEIGI